MQLPSEKVILRLLLGALAILAVGAGVLHFTDDSEPDLSRFTRPVHDPVAYAKVKALCETFTIQAKPYQRNTPNDPLDTTMLLGRAQRGDAHAVRCLREYLKENEAALVSARELVGLKQFSCESEKRGTLSTVDNTIENAHRLLREDTLRAGIAGDTATAWQTLGECLGFARVRECTVAVTDALDCESIARDAANTLCAFEKEPARIRVFLSHQERHAPDARQGNQAVAAQIHFIANEIRTRRASGETIGEAAAGAWSINTPAPIPGMPGFLNRMFRFTGYQWVRAHTLPNATLNDCAQFADRLVATNTPVVSHTPSNWQGLGWWMLSRNAGGRVLSDFVSADFIRIRVQYFSNRAHHDLSRVALALRVYELEHEGRRPATLAELAPGILAAVPADLFDGKPLRYDAATGKVWSVGADLRDDGGNDAHDIVVAPAPLAFDKPSDAQFSFPLESPPVSQVPSGTSHGVTHKTYF